MQMQTILIIGPSGSGKTALACALAHRLAEEGGASLVNADKMFLYKGFRLASGLSDTIAAAGDLPRRCYELLSPGEKPFEPAPYSNAVLQACGLDMARGLVPVVEGGSTTCVPAIVQRGVRGTVVGLLPPSLSVLRDKTAMRMDAALKAGLLDEIAALLPRWRHSLPMTTGCGALPFARHLEGEISLDEAMRMTIEYAERQFSPLLRLPNVCWIGQGATPDDVLAQAERFRG